MAFDSFLRIEGIPGESTDDKHRDWIELTGFSHEIEQPASNTASSVGGASAERVTHKTFNITHLVDKSSPKIYDACCTGKHLSEVVIEVCRSGGDKLKYFEIRLEQVLISKVELSGSADERGFPEERVSLNYGRIRWVYTQQKRSDGSSGGNITAGWDLTTNRSMA